MTTESADSKRRAWERLRRLSISPFWQLLGLELLDVDEGYCKLRLHARYPLLNPGIESVIGGVLATVVDEGVATLLHTAYDMGREITGHTTTELSISFLAAAVGPYVETECRLVRKGRTLAVGEVYIRTPEGVLAATGRATYMVFGFQERKVAGTAPGSLR